MSVKIIIDLSGCGSDDRWLRRSRMLAFAIKPLLETTVRINRLYLRTHPKCPLLYESGVRYENEPGEFRRAGVEDFAIIPAVLRRGWGDCDDLAPFRVAELKERFGECAGIRVQWRRQQNGAKLYHVLVRRADGSLEDPSRILGMGKNRR